MLEEMLRYGATLEDLYKEFEVDPEEMQAEEET